MSRSENNKNQTQNPASLQKGIRAFLLTAVSAGIVCTAFGYTGMAQAQMQRGLPVPAQHFLFGKSMVHQAAYNEAVTQGTVGGEKLSSDGAAIKAFYESRDYKPYWTDSRRNLEKARAVVALLQDSWTQGLNPDEYHVKKLSELLADGNRDEDRLELLMTDAAGRYGRDMTGMRVNAAAANESAKYWRQPLAYNEILTRIGNTENPKRVLEDLAPKGVFYNRLREELIRLSQESGTHDSILPIRLGGKPFYPGDRSTDVAALRTRLGVTHDSRRGPENYYDDETAAAVMNFQRENGLDADGVIGPKTLALLNLDTRAQMAQVIANMERLRWMDEKKPERYILVNIPSQRLWAVDKGEVVHEMDVIVGKPDRQTKTFKAEIQGIRFNPKWNVPMGIKVKDFLPKLREDPTYLSQKGIEIYLGTGSERRTIDGTEIDWSSMTRADMSRLTMVQRQGANNALGRIRVLMPNDYDIYLHDTNTPEYFEKSKRTLSSGCVRMSHPEDIARFVLSRNEGWSDEKMQRTLERGATAEVMASTPFPVYLVYQTMWLDSEGRLVYGDDVYKRDQRLLKVLADAGGLHILKSGVTRYADISGPATRKF